MSQLREWQLQRKGQQGFFRPELDLHGRWTMESGQAALLPGTLSGPYLRPA